MSLKNWSGNITYSTTDVRYPNTTEEVQEIVWQAIKLRVLGSRHSFNRIADSTATLVCLDAFNDFAIDTTTNTVTVGAGTRYGDLAPYLHQHGFALHNLASLPHITVVGACATGTHGSGMKNGSLASAVAAIELIDANGSVVHLSRSKDGDMFNGAVVNLGALGVVTKLTLDLLPAFDMTQFVYLDLPISALETEFMALQAMGYSVSLFTDWQRKTIAEVWMKARVDKANAPQFSNHLHGAKLSSENVHPIAGESAENVTDQMGVLGPWYDRLPHFKMGFKPSAGNELQSEFFVAIEDAFKAIQAIEVLHKEFAPHLFISEIRTVAADEFWLSPFYHRPSVAFHFTWKQNREEVMRLISFIEDQLAPFYPRPHWAKLFTMSPAVLQTKYKRLNDFRELANRFDLTGKFRNDYLAETIF